MNLSFAIPNPVAASPELIGLMVALAGACLVVAVYAAFGVFDPKPSATADLDRCPRCGRPCKALEYHLRKCQGRIGERHTQAFGRGQRHW